MKQTAIIVLFSLLAQSNLLAQETNKDSMPQAVCPVVKIQPEQMPSLNTPRSGHHTLCVNGEITVFGGHTSGFVPTRTAEYFKDGAWHQMDMVYTHDAGSALVLKSGKVLLSGGFERGLGIGQSHEVEMYDPKTHTFDGFGCLDTKRASHTQVELDHGKVVIAGNWYHEDVIEIYDGDITFTNVKKVSQQRTLTNVFRIAPDDVIIFGGQGYKGNDFDTIIVDRLKGEPFTDPLFETWKPTHLHISIHNDDSFIGDETDLETDPSPHLYPQRRQFYRRRNERHLLLPLSCEEQRGTDSHRQERRYEVLVSTYHQPYPHEVSGEHHYLLFPDSCGSKGSERIHHGQRFHSSDQQPYIHPVHRL